MPDKKKILLVLPRGESIRNFVFSGTLDILSKHAEVHLLSVFPNKEIEGILKAKAFKVHELKYIPQKWILRFTREWLDMVHGRSLWSMAAKFRWKLRQFDANTLPKKIKRISKELMVQPFSNQKGTKFLSDIEEKLSQKVLPDPFYLNFLKEIKPDLVFLGSHVHSVIATPVMHAAKALKIKTGTFLFSWDNLTSQGRIMPSVNRYISWNREIADHLLEIYPFLNPSQVSVTGTPQFDFHFDKNNYWTREEYCKIIGADPSRPIVLYTTGMANHMPGEDLTVERIGDMLNRFEGPNKPQLVCRIYPKDLTGRFNEKMERRKDIIFPKIPWEPNWLTPTPEDIKLWTNMLLHCELGINIASTTSLELCMFDKPVLNVAYDPFEMNIEPYNMALFYTFDHYKPIVDSGAVKVCYSEKELEESIHSELLNPLRASKERAALLNKFFGNTLDGKSHERIANVLLTDLA